MLEPHGEDDGRPPDQMGRNSHRQPVERRHASEGASAEEQSAGDGDDPERSLSWVLEYACHVGLVLSSTEGIGRIAKPVFMETAGNHDSDQDRDQPGDQGGSHLCQQGIGGADHDADGGPHQGNQALDGPLRLLVPGVAAGRNPSEEGHRPSKPRHRQTPLGESGDFGRADARQFDQRDGGEGTAALTQPQLEVEQGIEVEFSSSKR